jgi:hypothetical protein
MSLRLTFPNYALLSGAIATPANKNSRCRRESSAKAGMGDAVYLSIDYGGQIRSFGCFVRSGLKKELPNIKKATSHLRSSLPTTVLHQNLKILSLFF